MTLDELKIKLQFCKDDKIEIVFYYNEPDSSAHKYLDLAELENFQGRLAIAAAKLRGKLAKEATS